LSKDPQLFSDRLLLRFFPKLIRLFRQRFNRFVHAVEQCFRGNAPAIPKRSKLSWARSDSSRATATVIFRRAHSSRPDAQGRRRKSPRSSNPPQNPAREESQRDVMWPLCDGMAIAASAIPSIRSKGRTVHRRWTAENYSAAMPVLSRWAAFNWA
jgi:hypothetical protein